jgi:hypothetical protein
MSHLQKYLAIEAAKKGSKLKDLFKSKKLLAGLGAGAAAGGILSALSSDDDEKPKKKKGDY